MDSPIPWVGGKKILRDEILSRFPFEYKRYIEVFGGGGWVLFRKLPRNDFEVYNDFNPNLVNLFQCVRDKADELIGELEFTLNSRLDFNHIRGELKKQVELPDAKRAAYYYQIIRQSYANKLDSFGAQPCSMWSKFPIIRTACRRLQKVVIENKDFEKLIKHYDRPEAFFYCDPPYYSTEHYYENVDFTPDDHERLANALNGIQGKFLLSYNDCPEIIELYKRSGIVIESTSRLSNLAQRYENGAMYAELLIANYDTTERARNFLQLSMFDDLQNPMRILNERKIIFNETFVS